MVPVLNETCAQIRAMSFNIRVDHEEDRNTENAWVHRLDKVVQVINRYAPDILALQEPTKAQLNDLEKNLNRVYSWILTPSSDRDPSCEVLAIAFNKDRFELETSGRVWLAPDPNSEPESPAWDGSKYPRIAVYGTFKDKKTERTFKVLNSHFDHKGSEARIHSANLIVSKANELSGKVPYLILGDFNTFPTDQKGYNALNAQESIIDVREVADKIEGPESTWIGWEYSPWYAKKFPEKLFRLDHIFLSRSAFYVPFFQVIDDQFQIGSGKRVYPSDHRPILLDFEIK